MRHHLALTPTATFAVALALSPLIPAHVAAQDAQQPQRPFDVHSIIKSAHGVAQSDGQILAIGGGIEASFEDGGRVVVTPLLGRAAPHNMPLSLELDGVLRGNEPRIQVGDSARPSVRTNQVDYRHGHGIVERYVSRADGVKHSVLLEQPVPGSGDLVVRMDVTTDLLCEHSEHARQLDFAAHGPDGETIGGIHIGTVVGVDAKGDRVEGSMRFDGEHLDLVLPAAFVDRATWPIDVDPLLGGLINVGLSFDDNEPDVAFDVTNDVYGVAFQFESSATDYDIWLQYVSGAGARVGGAILIAGTSGLAQFPKIANCNATDQFVIVWQEDTSGTFDVKCRSVDIAARTTAPVVDIAVTGATEINPDIAGDSTLNAPIPQCLCVWDEGMAVKSCVIELISGSPVINNVSTVLGSLPIDNPVLTKDGGSARRYFMAFQVSTSGVSVLPLDANGTILGGPTTVANSTTTTFSRPEIDGNGDHFTVVMEELEQGSMTNHDIRASHGIWNGAIQLVDSFLIEADPGFDERRPCIAVMNSKYVAAWIDANANGTDIEAGNLGIDSAALCGNTVRVAGSSTRDMINPAVASRLSGGDAGSDAALIAHREVDLTNGNALLRARIYTAFGGGPVTTVAGTGGCANGATTGVGSPAALGNQNFTITLTGGDPAAGLAVLFVDPNLTPPVSLCGMACGGIITPLATAQTTATNGRAALGIAIPCIPTLSGASVHAQWLQVGGSAAGGCTLVSGVRPSDAVLITIGD